VAIGMRFDFDRFSIEGKYTAEPGYRDSEVDIDQTISVSNGTESFHQELKLGDKGFDYNQGASIGVSYDISGQWKIGVKADWCQETADKIEPSSGTIGVADTSISEDKIDTYMVGLLLSYRF
jgi:hypothetical protein